MKERFEGENGRQLLEETLRKQRALSCHAEGIARAAEQLELIEVDDGHALIIEGKYTTDVFFVLMGAGFQILVSGRPVAAREPGELVGEMAALEPDTARSATAKAVGPTVVGKLTGEQFRSLCDDFPEALYGGMARTLADKLRQRAQHVRPRAVTPKVFVGSSTESLPVANAFQRAFEYSKADVRVWTDTAFKPASTAIEDLAAALEEYDFAVFVATPDDQVRVEGKGRDDTPQRAMRDNVLLEFGLFTGALGRDRVFLLQPRGTPMRRPTDLAGVTPLDYDPSNEELDLAVKTAAAKLQRIIGEKRAR